MTLRKCYSCPYARWISVEDATEPKLECDPPMGECPAEHPTNLAEVNDYPPGTNAGRWQ